MEFGRTHKHPTSFRFDKLKNSIANSYGHNNLIIFFVAVLVWMIIRIRFVFLQLYWLT